MKSLRFKTLPASAAFEVVRGVTYDKAGSSTSPLPGYIPVLRAGNIADGQLDVANDLVFVSPEFVKNNQLLRVGDIVMATSSGSIAVVGKTGLLRREWYGSFGAFCACLRPRDGWSPAFLLYTLQTSDTRRTLSERARGVNINNLKRDQIESLAMPMVDFATQNRIVAAIETQFTRLDAAVATLQRVRANLKRARASVLKAAVEGSLVPTEAELARAEGRPYEPANVLLQRILEERKARWPKGKKYVAPVAPEVEGLPGLPEGWAWAAFDSLAEIVGGVTKDQKQTEGRLVPYLRVANVQRGRLDLTEVKSILAPEDKINVLRLQVGDILLNEGGDRDKLGRGWIWQGELPECIHQNHVFRARVRLAVLQPRYLSHYANTQGGHYFQDEGKQTTNLASISLTKVKALPVAVPPAAEQVRIVAEVERRLSLLDKLDATVDLNLTRCNRLRQSILKRAFEGKLVPQDPQDEDASKLLDRIQSAAKDLSA